MSTDYSFLLKVPEGEDLPHVVKRLHDSGLITGADPLGDDKHVFARMDFSDGWVGDLDDEDLDWSSDDPEETALQEFNMELDFRVPFEADTEETRAWMVELGRKLTDLYSFKLFYNGLDFLLVDASRPGQFDIAEDLPFIVDDIRDNLDEYREIGFRFPDLESR